MAQSVFKHGSKCINNIIVDFRRLIKREIALSELRIECRRHLKTAWHEATRPPATEQRKRAIRYLNEGMYYYNNKHYTDAAIEFEEAIGADPKYGRAHLYYGNAKYKLHDTEEALRAWESTIRVDPSSPAADKAKEYLDRLRTKTQQAIHEMQAQLRES